MPTVPRLETQQVQSSGPTGARFSVRATPADLGAGIGEGISQLGSSIGQIAREEKTKADSLAVTDADSQMATWETETLYNSDTGALNTRGKDAFGIPDTVMESYKAKVSELEKLLTNDDQKLAFRQMASARGVDVDRTVQRHVSSEYQRYDDQATAAALVNSTEAAAANYTDPERIDTELNRQRAYITSQAARNGEPAELTTQRIEEVQSNTHVAIIDRMLADRDYKSAEQYYEARGDEINASVRDNVESAMRTGKLRGESIAKTDEIMGKGVDRSEGLRQAREIDDAELRDETVRRVNTRYDSAEAIKNENARVNLENATDSISNDATVDSIEPAVWNSFNKEERSQLRRLQQSGEWFQDDAKWYEFTQKTNEEIADMNLLAELRPYVDDQHWDRAVAEQKAINGEETAELTNTLNFRQRLENTLQGTMFDDVNKLSDDEATRYGQIENEASRLIQAQEEEKKRKLTGTEMQEVIDDLILEKVNISEFGRDPEKLLFEVQEDEAGSAYVNYSDIPSDEITSIENVIISNDGRVTRDKVEKAYAAFLLNDPALFSRLTME